MENTATPTPAPEKREKESAFSRVVRLVSYPVAAVSGFWAVNTSVRESSHHKAFKENTLLKRNEKPPFQDIADKFEGLHIKDLKARDAGDISKEEFLTRSVINKAAHSTAVTKKMEHLGLGSFTSKWRYINDGAKQKAVIEGLTVSGIAIGALLTIASSKSLGNIFSGNKDQDKSR